MSNRRDFLKKLGFASLAPIVPKIATTEAVSTATTTLIAGKIKTGGLLAHIEGPERMRITSSGMFSMNDGYIKKFNEQYEQQLWAGNSITNKK